MQHSKKRRTLFGVLLVVCLVSTTVMVGACGSNDGDSNGNANDVKSDSGAKTDPGALPILKIGDTWTQKGSIFGTECTMVLTVTGEEAMGNKEAYIIECAIEYSMGDISGDTPLVDTIIMKMDKSNMLPLEIKELSESLGDQYEETTTYPHEITGVPYFPKMIGNETTIVTTVTTVSTIYGETETATETITSTYKIEKVEDITVPAGTFTCFKEVKYDESGAVIGMSWDSAEVKFFGVKSLDNETDETMELISYSVKQ